MDNSIQKFGLNVQHKAQISFLYNFIGILDFTFNFVIYGRYKLAKRSKPAKTDKYYLKVAFFNL